jgi:hypothetical protein
MPAAATQQVAPMPYTQPMMPVAPAAMTPPARAGYQMVGPDGRVFAPPPAGPVAPAVSPTAARGFVMQQSGGDPNQKPGDGTQPADSKKNRGIMEGSRWNVFGGR